MRYPRGYGFGVSMAEKLRLLPVGRGEVLRNGGDVSILALGSVVQPALEAAKLLEKAGVRAGVANARFAKPLDKELIIELANRTGKLVTVEENALAGGFGGAVLELLASQPGLTNVEVECIAIPDRFVEHGPQELFRSMFDLDAEGIARRVSERFPGLASPAFTAGGEKIR